MSKQLSKIINAVLAILSIICFLGLDFYGLGSRKTFTGSEILEMCLDDNELWPLLFVSIPLFQLLIRLVVSKMQNAIACGCILFIPIITALFETDPEGLQIGFYIYTLISIAMIILPCFESENLSHAGLIGKSSRTENEVKNYSIQQLQEIINTPAIYNDALINACKNELDIRTNAESMMPEIEKYSDEKINEILSDKTKYSATAVFCCETIKAERTRKILEEKQAELQRIAKEREEKRNAFIDKWRWVIIGGTIAFFALVLFIFLTSNGHYFDSGVNSYNTKNYEKAIKKLSKIDDTDYPGYLGAKYFLYKSYTEINDTVNAPEVLSDIYEVVADLDADELHSIYNMPHTYDAYNLCADALMVGHKDIKDVKNDYNTAIKLYEITGRETQIGLCCYYKRDYQKAFDILKEEAQYDDDIIAKVYLGLMYTTGNGCARDIHDAFWTFNEVDIENFLTPSLLEEGTDWVLFMGELWNVDIIRKYLVAKGDLQLIYGTLSKHSYTFGEGVDMARKCYSKATELFPAYTAYAKRHHYVEQLYNIEGSIENTNNFDDWYYRGEYIKDNGYPKNIRPYGYGMYHEYTGMWSDVLKRVVIGNFGKSGRSFTWGKDALLINRDSNDNIYYVGYYDKNGEYHFFDEYVTD